MEEFPCETYYYRIGSNVRRLRQEKHMTQEKLAEAAGLSLKMIQKLEVGQRGFRMETIIRIAITLDVSLDVLADMRGGWIKGLHSSRKPFMPLQMIRQMMR